MKVEGEQESWDLLSCLQPVVLLHQLPGSLKLSSRVWGKSAANILTGHCCSC